VTAFIGEDKRPYICHAIAPKVMNEQIESKMK